MNAIRRSALRHAAAASTILCLCWASNARAEVVYSQTSSDPSQTGFGWYSTSEPRPTRNFKHADNFVLGSTTQISGINWWGLSEGISSTDLSNFDTFQIEFWTSLTQPNGRIRPAMLFASETFNLHETDPTDTGRRASSGAIEFMHHASFTNSIALNADTIYWISISARSIDPSGDVWQWQDADDADRISSSWSYATGTWQYLVDTDSAFELISIPAPSSIPALCAGLSITCRRRRVGTPPASSL